MTFKFRKARSDATLSDLESFLRNIGDEPIEFLTRTFDDWRTISYDELEELILSGRLQDLIDWRERYAEFVNTKLAPLWLTAIQTAAYNSTRGKITIDDSDPRVKEFLRQRAGELITQLSDESRKAVANVILHGQAEHLAPREIARQIRPLIGLNQRQAQANVNYRQKIFRQLIDSGLSTAQAQIRADKAAIKYASKQHRQRAETIVHTELSRAYNVGAHEGVLSAQRAGFMNVCEMVWTTSGTNRVCGRCLSLKDTVVGRTNEQGVQLPPLHPRCRCTISYRELTSHPSSGNVGSTTDALAAPYPTGHGYRSPTHFPQAVSGCKTFDELKLYWADNYNMKVADAIGNLHFDSVRQALAGVETVLKEFPPAAQHLREFDLLNSSIMTTERGNGKINFNPEYFNDAAKLTAALAAGVQSGFYPKNMTIFGAGAHEAGHIVEDWLIAKYGGNKDDIASRTFAQKVVLEAYVEVIRALARAGEFKSLWQLKIEIAGYTLKNESECMALGISDYTTNEMNSAELSISIWQRLKKELIQ